MIRSTFRVRPMVSIDRSADADSNGPGMMIQQLQYSCRYDGAEAVEFCDWRRGRPETGSVSHGGTIGGW
jgi:hypothetical protein